LQQDVILLFPRQARQDARNAKEVLFSPSDLGPLALLAVKRDHKSVQLPPTLIRRPISGCMAISVGFGGFELAFGGFELAFGGFRWLWSVDAKCS
jgi:hypothetical protein